MAKNARVVTCMLKPRELKVLSRGGPRIFLGIQMLELLVNCFLKALDSLDIFSPTKIIKKL